MDYGYILGIYSGVMVVISSVVRAANVSTAKATFAVVSQLLVTGIWVRRPSAMDPFSVRFPRTPS